MNVYDFAVGTEKLINPIKVGTVHHLQKSLSKLPVCIQRKIVTSASKKAGRMGFVVEPYAFFLAYEIADPDKAATHLPDGFVLAESSIFAGDKPKFYGIACIFRVHTGVFWGIRTECYIIAKNERTGLLSWVIVDYMSDTISYDKKSGLRSPDSKQAVVTTTCEGEYIADISRINDKTFLRCHADLKNVKMRDLDKKKWIDGNTSICYSKDIGGDDGSLFSLTFLPEEMKQAWDVPLKNIHQAETNWHPEVLGGKLDKAICFPFAQHMLSDAPGVSTHYGSEELLRKAAESVDFKNLNALNK